MEFKELKNKSLSELQQLVKDYKAELFLLRFKNSTAQQEQTHKISEVRKNIAKVLTAIKQQELSEKEVTSKKGGK